jgi:hypothetical protein
MGSSRGQHAGANTVMAISANFSLFALFVAMTTDSIHASANISYKLNITI